MNRRQLLAATAFAGVAARAGGASIDAPLRRPIGRGKDTVPVIGMGTWLTFDIGDGIAETARRREVLREFFAGGGGMIDSSPMYGRAEGVLGRLLPDIASAGQLFSATKIWTAFERAGRTQFDESLRLWRLPRFDVELVHNLLNWRAHLKTLAALKDLGRVRFIGVSTSHGRKHDEIEHVIRNEPIDVIQITYNLADTSAERAMQLAAERGVAVVINRPFDGGLLFDRASRLPLPAWAAEIDGTNWAQIFLKWVIAHPAVTCAIPATTNPAHMKENMGANRGRLPDAGLRRRLREYFERS